MNELENSQDAQLKQQWLDIFAFDLIRWFHITYPELSSLYRR